MKVKLKVSLAGPKVHHGVGDIVDFDDKTAADLVKRGYADAVAKHVENADSPGGKR